MQAYLCQEELHYSFAIYTSAQMARIVKNMMDEQGKEEQTQITKNMMDQQEKEQKRITNKMMDEQGKKEQAWITKNKMFCLFCFCLFVCFCVVF